MRFPAVAQSPREATVAAQHVLNLMHPGKRLAIDGVIGPQTVAAFRALDTSAQAAVSDFLVTRNPAIIAGLTGAVADEPGRYISQAQAVSLIEAALAKYGMIPVDGVSSKEFLLWKMALESARGPNGTFDTKSKSRSGLFLGLYQLGSPAWTDVQRAVRDPFSSIPWGIGAVDAVYATQAAVIYSRLTATYLRSFGYKGPLTKEVMYAAYNQGASGFYRENSPWYRGQSSVAQNVLKIAAKTAGVRISAVA